MTKTLLAISLSALAACRDQRPPAPNPQQSSQLNEADRMLDNLANEEGPEANASGPSNSSD